MDRVRESGVEFPESLMLRKHLGAVNEWLARAQAALAGSVQLRELEKLLAEAEKLAVEPGPKLPELQAKMDKALGWLEKVRKAVPKQRSTRRTMDTEVEKVRWFNGYFVKTYGDLLRSAFWAVVIIAERTLTRSADAFSNCVSLPTSHPLMFRFPELERSFSTLYVLKEAVDELGYAAATFGLPGLRFKGVIHVFLFFQVSCRIALASLTR